MIFANSLLHHISDNQIADVFTYCKQILKKDGTIHVLDHVLPQSGISRSLTLADRGKYPRIENEWKFIFQKYFDAVKWENFDLTLCKISLWKMFYFIGRVNA
jgi:hypothetical protein